MELAKLAAGDEHYKAYVGPPLKYDLLGALQFTLLCAAGLRSTHKICDIGCGSLRVGKMLIPYLNPGNYYGIEPNQWLIDEAIKEEIGADLVRIKKPQFINASDFKVGAFNQAFDFCIAQSIFSHSSKAQVEQCLSEVAQNLASDGLFLATFIWGKNDYEGEEWVYPGCVEFKASSIKELAWSKYGLKMQRTNWPHPNGQNWVLFHFPGNEKEAEKIAHFNLGQYDSDIESPKGSDSLKGKVISKLTRALKK
jgi:SAM-dependent methyltransferase